MKWLEYLIIKNWYKKGEDQAENRKFWDWLHQRYCYFTICYSGVFRRGKYTGGKNGYRKKIDLWIVYELGKVHTKLFKC
jgi:hypothetical protein